MGTTDQTKLEPAIFELFKKLGFERNDNGCKYAADFVKDCFDKIPDSITDWYEHEAQRYGKNAGDIERSIRRACRNAIGTNNDILFDIFDEQTITKPNFASNSNFLTGLYRHLAAELGLTRLAETESR